MKAIEITNFSKKYKELLAVDNISLDINFGEIFGFIGQNGAGKSTTIRMLMNLIYPTSGGATIMGLDCTKCSKEIKKQLSYVPSEVEYYSSFKVKDLLNMTCELNDINEQERINQLCEYLELDQERLINQLSLGNRKKVSVIQALIKHPKIIILDEPASGLDPLMQDKLFKLLLEEKEKGACVFLSSHNLVEVEKYCDRVAIIKQGKIVKVEALEELKKSNNLRVKYTSNNIEKTFDYEGDINELLKQLSKEKIDNLEITHVSLEEQFMKYYEVENE